MHWSKTANIAAVVTGGIHMARSKTNRRKNRARNTLQGKGVSAVTVGIGLLLMSLFFGSSPVLASLAAAIRIPAWFALGIGLVLLGLHYALKPKVNGLSELPRIDPNTPMPKQPWEPRMSADVVFDIRPPSAVKTHSVPPDPESYWSPAVFAAIEWRRFEAVCELLFKQAGFETKSQSHGADGGVDIWLHSRNAEGSVAVVQCKHWQGKAVGVKELREFFGVMASNKLKRGTYATTSTYTADAAQFAKDNSINTLDGKAMLAQIAKRTPEQQQALLAVAFEGEYWRPTCASCGVKLIERTPAKGGAAFWGCTNYPGCKSRLPMLAAAR
jgi:restriction system protein